MEQSSLKANMPAGNQFIPHILQKPKIHCPIHKT
jgi:hypothetical protein